MATNIGTSMNSDLSYAKDPQELINRLRNVTNTARDYIRQLTNMGYEVEIKMVQGDGNPPDLNFHITKVTREEVTI